MEDKKKQGKEERMRKQNKESGSSSIDSIVGVLFVLFISAIPFAGAFFGYERGIEKGESNILDKLEELGMDWNLRNKLHWPGLYGFPRKEELCNAFCGKTDFTKEEEAEIGDSWGYEDVL